MTQTKQSWKKNPDTSALVKKADNDAEITELEGKILSISDLAANAALTAVENRIPNVSNLVKKQIMAQKLLMLKRKLLIMIIINILLLLSLLAVGIFNARLKQTDLVIKTDFDDKLRNFNQNINSNKTKLFIVEN